MAQYFSVHPDNPQRRLVHQTVDIIRQGGIVVLPTDSSYAIACHIGDKRALDNIRRIRQLSDKHNFTLLCKDLTQISNFTKIGNDAFRLIKSLTPGAFTFILNATKEVPKRLQHPKKKTIGIRIPNNAFIQQVLDELDEPLFSSTLILPDNNNEAETDPYEIREKLEHELNLIIDFGIIESQETTMISCIDSQIEITRQGVGDAPMLV
jgi:tRNA threonylcarbamoyl adenosine modification protein (Sua5/YciO/YrdC/YwlC family)